MSHLPILQVLVPLLSATLCVLIPSAWFARTVAIGAAVSSLWIAVTMLMQVTGGQPLVYELGGFPPPWGIEYRVDNATAYILVIVSMIASVVMSFGPTSGTATRIPHGREHLFYATLLLALTGMLGITVTGDAFNVFVFLEITSLSSYALIGMGTGKRAPVAAYSYLILGTIGGTFYLLGVGLCYQMTGTLNMGDLAVRLLPVQDTRTVVLGFALIAVGLSIKLAVFPLHQWLPNAYTYAPPVVSAFLAATATKVMYYVLARMIFTVFGAAYVFGVLHIDRMLLPLSVVAMFAGSLAAIYQTDIKRLLAFSSVAQIGYMTLGLAYNSELGLTGGFVHLFNHALMKGGLFLVVACVTYRIGSSQIGDMAGLGRRMPLTMAAFVTGGLAIIGVPGTVGFVSKWYLVLGALEKGWYGIAFLILLSSMLAVVYVWKVIEVVYFGEAKDTGDGDGSGDGKTGGGDAPLSMLIPTWVLIAGTVVFGFNTDATAGVARQVAQQLMGTGS